VVHLLLDQLPHGLIGVQREHGTIGGAQEIDAAPHLRQLVADAAQARGAVPALSAEQGGRSVDVDDAHLQIARRTAASFPPYLHPPEFGTARTGLLGSQRLPLFSSLSLPLSVSECVSENGKGGREMREKGERVERGSPGEEMGVVCVFYSCLWF
jgi:hypothetical protein